MMYNEDWLNEIVKCPCCHHDVRDGDRIWLNGECLCPRCYEHKRRMLDNKEHSNKSEHESLQSL